MGKQKGQQTWNPEHHYGRRYERPFEWWASLNPERRKVFLTNSLKTADKLRRLHPETATKVMSSIGPQWLLPPDTDVLSLSRYDQWQAYRATQKIAAAIRRKTRAADRQGGS